MVQRRSSGSRSRARGSSAGRAPAPPRKTISRPTRPAIPFARLIPIVLGVIVLGIGVGVLFTLDNVKALFGTKVVQPTPTPTLVLSDNTPEVEATPTLEPTPTPVTLVKGNPDADTLVIRMVGDIMCTQQQLDDALDRASGIYDFSGAFAQIAPYLHGADLAIGNLDTTVSGKDLGYSGYPLFNSPDALLSALRASGMDVLTTANHQAFDKGWTGVVKTVENIQAAGMQATGTYLSSDEYYKPLIVEKKGAKIAILAYTQGTNRESDISSDKLAFCIKYYKLDTLKRDVEAAREAGADIIIAYMHWGSENTRSPSSTMRSSAQDMLDNGVDVIFGSNSRMVQSITRKTMTRAGKSQDVIVAYSLGNFISSMRDQYNDTGIVLSLTYKKDAEGSFRLDTSEYLPIWVYVGDTDIAQDRDFTVMPLNRYIENETLKNELYPRAATRVQQAWDETLATIGTETVTPVQGE